MLIRLWIILTIVMALVALYALISNIRMRNELDRCHYIFDHLIRDKDIQRIIERYRNQ